MHIADGILPVEVVTGGLIVTGAAVTMSLRRFDERRIPEIGVLTSFFFVASLVHIPIGATSVHLLFISLLGIVLGKYCVPSIFVALLFQALLVPHGGLLATGVNTVVLGSGALASHAVFRGLWRLKRTSAAGAAVFAWIATLVGFVVSAALYLLAIRTAERPLFDMALVATLLWHVPVMCLEALVTGAAVSFLVKVKPEALPQLQQEGAVPC